VLSRFSPQLVVRNSQSHQYRVDYFADIFYPRKICTAAKYSLRVAQRPALPAAGENQTGKREPAIAQIQLQKRADSQPSGARNVRRPLPRYLIALAAYEDLLRAHNQLSLGR
jgi:hypothetical protein